MGRSVTPGRVLGGRYRLDHEIARGGMATVWRGEDPLLARAVAVKTLDETLAGDADLRSRFRREAIAAAAVTHPNIVATYDTGEDDGVAYIVMELVEGATLRQAIDLHGALPVARAADIGAQVADALAAAHARGLIHRDIKPSNVLVQLDGRVKVTDFGIAKATDQTADELTRTGSVMGTARYLAPEQLEGQAVDERADVYSLGLVLYEMLVGRAPFGADTELATAVARLTSDPEPLARTRPDIPPGLAHIVERAMQRDPQARWPNAAAMRDALAPFRVAVPDRRVDATVPVAVPPRPRPAAEAHPAIIIDDGIGLGARIAIWLLAIALGFGAGYAGYVIATRDDGSTTSAAPRSGDEPLAIASVQDFDPVGGDGENPELAAAVIDGDRTTFWTTESYFQPDVGGKPGVGLILNLAERSRIDSLQVIAGEGAWDAQVYVADAPATTLAGWGDPAATEQDLGTTSRIRLDGRPTGASVLLWLTRLPPSGEGRFVGRIAEVTVDGTPA